MGDITFVLYQTFWHSFFLESVFLFLNNARGLSFLLKLCITNTEKNIFVEEDDEHTLKTQTRMSIQNTNVK